MGKHEFILMSCIAITLHSQLRCAEDHDTPPPETDSYEDILITIPGHDQKEISILDFRFTDDGCPSVFELIYEYEKLDYILCPDNIFVATPTYRLPLHEITGADPFSFQPLSESISIDDDQLFFNYSPVMPYDKEDSIQIIPDSQQEFQYLVANERVYFLRYQDLILLSDIQSTDNLRTLDFTGFGGQPFLVNATQVYQGNNLVKNADPDSFRPAFKGIGNSTYFRDDDSFYYSNVLIDEIDPDGVSFNPSCRNTAEYNETLWAGKTKIFVSQSSYTHCLAMHSHSIFFVETDIGIYFLDLRDPEVQVTLSTNPNAQFRYYSLGYFTLEKKVFFLQSEGIPKFYELEGARAETFKVDYSNLSDKGYDATDGSNYYLHGKKVESNN